MNVKITGAAILLVAALTTSVGSPAAATATHPQNILVIVNKSVDQRDLTRQQLKNIFLKKRKNWSASKKAVPIHAPASSSLRADFDRRALGMNISEEKTYWQKRKIEAGVMPPAEFSDPLKAVFHLRGSVSYVYRSDYKKGVAAVVLELAKE